MSFDRKLNKLCYILLLVLFAINYGDSCHKMMHCHLMCIAPKSVMCIIVLSLIHFGRMSITLFPDLKFNWGQLEWKTKTYSYNFHVYHVFNSKGKIKFWTEQGTPLRNQNLWPRTRPIYCPRTSKSCPHAPTSALYFQNTILRLLKACVRC